MKSKNKKRILALVLSMVLMLSTGISAMAEGEAGKGTTNDTALENQEPAVENQEENSESADTEGDKPEEIQKTAESEGQSETTEEKAEEETVSEAADLYQDFKDEDGNVITTIHAYVPEGAFQAKADQISMEAKLLDADSEDYIKGMIEAKLPENSYLGGYVLYEVNFMVDGAITEPAKAITLTIEGSGLSVTDLSKTKAFYYDPADPEIEGDEDQLVDMGQKADVLAYLAENEVAEDQINTYEYTELDIQNETAHQIGFNTWKSTIYGCYTEAYSAETTFTQEVDGVTVNVTAPEGTFPTAAENVSFTAAAVTEEQDTVISSQLDAKAEELGQEVKGYEAFALSFTVNGEEMQPQVPVSVSFENTGLPAEDVNGAQIFRLDEENRAVNELEGTLENGTASMTLGQMGTVGYWAYGDAVIVEEDSTSPEDESTPDGTGEKQPEDSVEEDSEAVKDDSQGGAEEDSEAVTEDSQGGAGQKEDGQGSAAEDREEESTEDGKEDTENPDQEEGSTDGTQDEEGTKGDAVENESQNDGKSETDTSKEEEGADTTKEDTEKEDSEKKEEVKKEEKEETTEAADEAKEEDADTEKEEETSKEDSKEEAVKELTYEDDSVTVTVSAEKEGIIPEGAALQVVPLLADDKETKDQYKEVEEKLQEKAENEEYEIAGFLAYDISFIDKDGNEVEPEGEVKVSMDYKKAALPEGMTEEESKEADVTMLHLEENSKGEVKEVVDMAEKDQVQTMKTTEEQKVEKIEVKTESFSTFTITWIADNQKYPVTVHYVNDSGGKLLVEQEEVTLPVNEDVILSEYAKAISGYYFDRAKIENFSTGITVTAIRVQKESGNFTYQYRTANSTQWITWSENPAKNVYLIYKQTNLHQLDTISSQDRGISIRMIDYDQAAFSGAIWDDKTQDGSGVGVKSGILSNKVAGDGYPTFVGTQWNTPTSGSLKKHYENAVDADNLFLESVYNDVGHYFYYSSEESSAVFNKDTGNFNVYRELMTPQMKADAGDENRYFFYRRGNFLPYNSIYNMKDSELDNLFDAEGERLAEGSERQGETLYFPDEGINYYFGMEMSAQFIQTKNGYYDNKPVRYEFTGDDDLWVYIDGVLVLDMGGCHDARSGYIDFSTGEVYVQGIGYTTIRKMFEAAGVHEIKWKEVEYTSSETGQKTPGYIFSDYSSHQFQMWYMERGGGASNLKVKFNLPVIPKGQIEIQKELGTKTDPVKYGDVKFGFKLYVQEADTQGNGTGECKLVKPEDLADYRAQKIDTSGKAVTLEMDKEGIFYLKPKEKARFSIAENLKYYVEEVDVKSDEYESVEVADVSNTEKFENGSTSTSYTARSREDTVGNRPVVAFTNNCSAKNLRSLTIEKVMKDSDTVEETFTINVFLEGVDGVLHPYSGGYRLVNENNQTIDEDGQIKDDACRLSTDDGTINLKHGWRAVIYNILSETEFKVTEQEPGKDYDNPKYSVSIIGDDNLDAEPKESYESAEGEIVLDKDSLVIVENSLVDNLDTPYMRVQKTFVGLDKDSLPQNFEINLYSDEACQNLVAVLTLDGKDGTIKPTSTSKDGLTFVWKLDNLEAGIYYLKESGQKDGYNHSIKVNNQEYTEQSVIEVSTQDAEYTFEKEQRISPCSATNSLEIQDPDYIVGGMDSKEVYFVWTKDTLSVGERNAIIQHIQTTFGTDFPKIKADTTAFFSTQERIETGLNYRGTIKLEKSGENTNLIFSAPSQWEQVVYGRYTKSDKVNAEIEVVNTYTQAVIDLQKYGSDYEMGQLPGAKFSLYQGTPNEGTEGVKWDEAPIEAYKEIAVTADATELKLKDGYYKLVETTAPSGYALLEDSIYFKVENRKVVLINEKGEVLTDNKTDMWEVDETGLVIKIKNKALYSLPSAGGSGIFLYMIGGTLLLIAGSLMIYINRRREVLKK